MGQRTSDPDEDAAFLKEVEDVQPYPSQAPPLRDAPPPPTRRDEDAEVMSVLEALATGEIPFEISDTGEFMEGLAEGIDRAHLAKLKRGDYSFQRFVDLHGLTRAAARAKVVDFILTAYRDGLRCVLIVHGRGLRSPDRPVLKDALKSWLPRGRIGRMVMAFSTARPVDGGAGATYVLLRRGASR